MRRLRINTLKFESLVGAAPWRETSAQPSLKCSHCESISSHCTMGPRQNGGQRSAPRLPSLPAFMSTAGFLTHNGQINLPADPGRGRDGSWSRLWETSRALANEMIAERPRAVCYCSPLYSFEDLRGIVPSIPA